MEVNVISPEERAKVEGKSYLRIRLAGFDVTTESPVQHAHRTKFYCSRKLSAAGRTGASFPHFHGLNRPSDEAVRCRIRERSTTRTMRFAPPRCVRSDSSFVKEPKNRAEAGRRLLTAKLRSKIEPEQSLAKLSMDATSNFSFGFARATVPLMFESSLFIQTDGSIMMR